jgi:heptosyltransferase-2
LKFSRQTELESETRNTQRETRILIVGPAWVGDMVLAHSLFQVLKSHAPDCTIDVAAPPWTLPLTARMPEVRAGIALDFKHGEFGWSARRALGKELAARHYDQAIVLPNSWKSALVPFFAGARRRTGYIGELRYGLLNDARRLDKARLPRTVDRFVALALASDAPLPPIPNPALTADRANAEATLTRLRVALPDKPVLALCPGAEYGPAKRWPVEYYAELARLKLTEGWAVWLFGSAKDVDITAAVQSQTDGCCVDLGGKTNLLEAVDLLAIATAVVTNDSGLMHIAAALARPVIALYGSSDPRHTPPMSPQAQVLYRGLACSPCFERECPLQHLNCLRDIRPAEVAARLAGIAQ